MVPVETPNKLIEFVKENRNKINGFLLSGGSTLEGKVPLKKFVDAIKWVKENTQLKVNIHTGIIDGEDVEYLKEMSPDHISFDVIGSTETIREVLGIKRTREDYFHALDLLEDTSLNYSPHIIAGLHFGKIMGEYEAVEKIKGLRRFSNLVLIILIPTRGTPMEDVEIDKPAILNFFRYTIRKIPKEKIVLGCMRPRDFHEVERLCVEANCKGMVMPSLKTLKYMDERGIRVERREMCCVF